MSATISARKTHASNQAATIPENGTFNQSHTAAPVNQPSIRCYRGRMSS
jgi:hypothetical protein